MTSEKKIKILVKPISAEETHTIRHPVLRKGKPITDCIFPFDDEKSSIHLGLFINNEHIGVVTYIKQQTPLLTNEGSYYQLRGMAILEHYQGFGYGKTLLDFGENLLKKKNINYIWCNAREIATPFYIKNGFEIIGEPFNIPNIGTHFTMYKQIL
ncbi:GNAT family N-acetyltransferase [Lacinutrix undariae]